MTGLFSMSYMGYHPNPIDELIFFKMGTLHHQPDRIPERSIILNPRRLETWEEFMDPESQESPDDLIARFLIRGVPYPPYPPYPNLEPWVKIYFGRGSKMISTWNAMDIRVKHWKLQIFRHFVGGNHPINIHKYIMYLILEPHLQIGDQGTLWWVYDWAQ